MAIWAVIASRVCRWSPAFAELFVATTESASLSALIKVEHPQLLKQVLNSIASSGWAACL